MMNDFDEDLVSSRQLEALLKVSRTIAAHQEFGALLDALGLFLHQVVEYDHVVLLLYDADTDEAWIYYPGSCEERLSKVRAFPFVDGPGFWVWKHQEPAIATIEDIERYYAKIFPKRRSQEVKSSCTVPLTTVRRRLGALEFLSTKANAYTPEDVRFMQLVAAQVATSVDNALVYERVKASEDNLARERDHLRTLLEVTNTAVSQLEPEKLIEEISGQIERLAGAEYCALVVYRPAENDFRWEIVRFSRGDDQVKPGRVVSMSDPVIARAFRQRKPCTFSYEEMEELSKCNDLMDSLRRQGIRSLCVLPLISHDATIGVLTVGHLSLDDFCEEDVRFLGEIAGQVSMSLSNTLAYREIRQLRDKLNSEKLYLEEEIREQHNFDEIIGESEKLHQVLEQVELVADSDSTVLILGDTGTGKELIARTIHNLSSRKSHTLVKVNCAAIPAGLLESDLFGHEKGAFTGATSQKIGRFELAHQGTIFLDEIGDIPLELQSKLLRALQEREIERLGSTRPIRVDARVIAATNRDLQQMIADRQFRSDLYYRLNVFPIYIPPLRERPEDIPFLVRYFVKKYARKIKRDIKIIPSDTMNALMRMPWPGNIRELEHLIERAVIVSRGSSLQVPLEPLSPGVVANVCERPLAAPSVPKVTTLERMEREHILRVLRDTNGIVGGPRGAAVHLGLKRTTLLSKMKRLGIARENGSAFS
ncbi:sigma 54-interacting transcriptional regulator [Telmatospirillum sp.]|uniref:sigma 54-interacting transcriptional regulator n=1 Tax=Telmatospirillum sp. TaxID=2079197 RepID=UPI00284D82F5|nr:sigma 54-interacting transcriptional regulator [Telmatospirillum sp.]MDR3437919.1 sigma 54-interacting transcriptional regulator [Telmatospirillum sp.]